MQQPVSRRDVYEPSLTARIGGRAVEVASASMDRALPDPLVGGSLTAASGELVTVEGSGVAEYVATPWDPGSSWPPAPEAPASVSMDTGSGMVSLLRNGRVVSASGGTSGREVSVEVADQYQSLDKTISWDAVAAAMPPLEWDWSKRRYVSMQSSAVTDRILRHCGWFSTPPPLSYPALSIPAQGTMWPEYGTCLHAGRTTAQDLAGYPGWVSTSWGVGVTDFEGYYRLGGPGYTLRDRPHLEMAALTTAPTGASRIELTTASGAGLAILQWTAATVAVRLRGPGGSYVTVVSVPRVDGLAYATVTYVSDTEVDATIRCGSRMETVRASVDSLVATGQYRDARVVSLGGAGGFQVAHPSTPGALENWAPNAAIRPRTASRNAFEVLPPVEGENCADLLAAQCEAEAATYWIDETGVLQWWDLARLEARSVVADLNSDDDIAGAGFTWEHSLSSQKSRTVVKWREPLREWKAAHAVTLYQGSGETMNPGDENVEEWITAPDDEVWIMPDTTFARLGLTGHDDFNIGHGSASGAVVAGTGDDADKWADQVQGTLITTMERVTDRAFKMTTSWSGVQPVVMRTPGEESTTSLWRVRRNVDLPIFRGKAKFMFTDRLTYSVQTGPVSAPEHAVDAGWWIQSEVQAQYTADYYGARVAIPQPVLSSVALTPIPGLQLGDMVEVRDTHVSRLTIRGLIIQDSRSINADMDMQHAVAIRPLYVTRNGVSWEEWASVVRPKSRAQWAASQSSTWAAWGANPLLKEEVI